MDTLPKIPRVIAPTRSTAVQVLREAIAQRLLRPGTRLSERQLATTLGISRPTLREALRELEAEGLLERDELGRLIVAQFDSAMALALYEVREVLEGFAAALFAQRATDDEIAELTLTLDSLAEAVAEDDFRRYLLLKDQFYGLLLAGARNPILESLLKSLQWRFRFLRATSLQAPGRLKVSLAEMREIVEAIQRRDARLADQRSRQHIRNAADAMFSVLDKTGTPSSDVPTDGRRVATRQRGGHRLG
ncbi:GntR family transcriptional regulator [Thermomicrobiaceae bacterium CFH 74404]|uniref:GntR family transcriptional regulator n=1 Tax=Thermalbibacter longus TaxID=2951981 RepID=A0AA42BB49_9BACT|nr:GntR family transcriptional regulator [Thermalbibacter longus]MCM8750527.1 GntR family transcriptional regulator [Thermalbibacter longus]